MASWGATASRSSAEDGARWDTAELRDHGPVRLMYSRFIVASPAAAAHETRRLTGQPNRAHDGVDRPHLAVVSGAVRALQRHVRAPHDVDHLEHLRHQRLRAGPSHQKETTCHEVDGTHNAT